MRENDDLDMVRDLPTTSRRRSGLIYRRRLEVDTAVIDDTVMKGSGRSKMVNLPSPWVLAGEDRRGAVR